MRMICDQLLRLPVDFLPNAKISRTAPGVIGRVRFTLMLRQRKERCIPGIRSQPRRIVNRKTEVIANFRTGDALRLIFMKPRRPFS